MQNIIEIKNAVYKYDDESEDVLHGVNLDIKKGEFLCILGHNGCGKSTLAKLINGLYQPTSGSVLVMGMDTKDEDKIIDIRSKAGMVFQNPDNQMVACIVEEDVAFGPENLGVPNPELRQRVDNALKTVNMFQFKDSAPHRLSGGQKQRIAIAGVLAMEPQIIIMDESTSMLDPKGTKEINETIKNLKLKTKDKTIISITHELEEALYADRILVLNKGQIVLDGTPSTVLPEKDILEASGLKVIDSISLYKDLENESFDKKEEIKIFVTLTPFQAMWW